MSHDVPEPTPRPDDETPSEEGSETSPQNIRKKDTAQYSGLTEEQLQELTQQVNKILPDKK